MTRALLATLGVLALVITSLVAASGLRDIGLSRRVVFYIVSSPIVVVAFCLGWSSITLNLSTPTDSTWGVIGQAKNPFQPNERWEYSPGGKSIERRSFVIPGLSGFAGILLCLVLANRALGRKARVLVRIALNLYFLLVVLIAGLWLFASYLNATAFAV